MKIDLGTPQPKKATDPKVTVITERVISVRYKVRCDGCGVVYDNFEPDYQQAHDLRFAHEEAHRRGELKRGSLA